MQLAILISKLIQPSGIAGSQTQQENHCGKEVSVKLASFGSISGSWQPYTHI